MRGALGRILFPARNAEALAWRAAVIGDGGSVSNPRLLRVDKLISALKGAGVWSKLDHLSIFAAENSQSALRDIVAARAGSVTSAPTFTADRGYTTNGTSSYVDTLFNPTSGSPNFVQDDAMWSLWSRTTGQTASSGNGLAGTALTLIGCRNASDQATWNVNTSSAGTVASITDGSGFYAAIRTAAAVTRIDKNGAQIGTGVAASGAITSGTFRCGERSGAFAAREWAACAVGKSLDATQSSNFYSAMLTYMQAVGAA